MSMYNDKIVVAIKVGGKVLREDGDTVSLPFGSEYSILIKNLESVRAQVSVSVDGTNATDGNVIIAPNSHLELERFIAGNMNAGNRFKFIERTKAIEEHRGVRLDDGLVRVEAWKEHIVRHTPLPIYPQPVGPPIHPGYRGTTAPRGRQVGASRNPVRGEMLAKTGGISGSSFVRPARPQHPQSKGMGDRRSMASPGITVPGSKSDQIFHRVSGFDLEPGSVVIVLRLCGVDALAVPVSEPVTVDAKRECGSCGKIHKANAEFCSQCGTALLTYA